MKFIYADSLDCVDPKYDFLNDRFAPERKLYWDDVFAHEILAKPPYDGILISRGIVGDHRFSGKYSTSQAMRFRRVGAPTFMRANAKHLTHFAFFGDCGAFSYHKMEIPPYTAEDMVEFYDDGQFSHGCSVDHIIFDFARDQKGMTGGSSDARSRYEITLQNARDFLKAANCLGEKFTPIGVVQGWSPGSMANAARQLVRMGYDYLALGGMAPLNAVSVHACLQAIRAVVPASTRLHILGFAKAEQIHEFIGYNITSFDSTSPLLRAFKDSHRNYYSLNDDGNLSYYTAIRIPQAIENPRLMKLAKAGVFRQGDLLAAEHEALKHLRGYADYSSSLNDTIDALMHYAVPLLHKPGDHNPPIQSTLSALRARYLHTLKGRPWEKCNCNVCKTCGVEVIIFRTSNRNKRRGIHNLHTYYKQLQNIRESPEHA